MPSYVSNFTFGNVRLSNNWTARSIGFSWTGDLNGDGHDDVLLTGASFPPDGNTPQKGGVFFGDGTGNFSAVSESIFPVSTLQTVHARQIVTGDFNGDGRPDIFIAAHGYDTDPFPGEQNRLYLTAANGTWVDATSTLPQLSDFSHSASVGDVNGDGFADIYVGNIYGQSQIAPYILMNDGSGHFARSSTALPNAAGGLFDFSRSSFTSSLLVDINNDGRNDLIVGSATSFGGGTSNVFFNNGSGFDQTHRIILPEASLPTSNRVTLSIAAIDINNDGLKDIITLSTRNDPFYVGTYIDVFINNNGTGFTLATNQIIGSAAAHPNGGWSAELKVIDVNNDGASDIVMSNYNGAAGASADSIFMLLNDGNGRLLPATMADLSASANFIAMQYANLPVRTNNGISFFHAWYLNGDLNANFLQATNVLPALTSAISGTNDIDNLVGTNAIERFFGLSGNDTIVPGGGNDLIDGGGGNDKVLYPFARTGSAVTRNADGSIQIVGGSGIGTDILTNIERVDFTDGDLIYDIPFSADPALVYRVYQAAFARVPDEAGFRFWEGAHRNNGLPFLDMAAQFRNSPEFAQKYGANVTNNNYVSVLYTNVLQRTPDAAGLAYWQAVLNGGAETRDQLLLEFASSPENVTLTAPNINNGYWVL